MQKNFFPMAIGSLLCAFFAANSAQARILDINNPLVATGTSIAYGAPQSAGASSGNYVSDVTQMGRIVWPISRMPLKVFINNGSGTPGYHEYYPDLMRKAFSEWQSKTNNGVRWQEVYSPGEADIVCTWTTVAKPNGPGVEAGETKSSIGVNRFTGEQNIIRANISVLTSLMGRSFSDTDMYKTCLHEVGHAIGMEGHSSTPSDIMYPVLNNAQVPYLKDRDINTIMALYAGGDNANYLARLPGGRSQSPRYLAQGLPAKGPRVVSEDPVPMSQANNLGQPSFSRNGFGHGGRFGRGGFGRNGFDGSGYSQDDSEASAFAQDGAYSNGTTDEGSGIHAFTPSNGFGQNMAQDDGDMPQGPRYPHHHGGRFMPQASAGDAFGMTPINIDDLSFEQRQALRRAIRDQMRFDAQY